jgi:hypothetical protein
MLLPILIASLAPLPGGTAPMISWGKPGVSFETYRADAIFCGRLGANLDVSNTPEAKRLIFATRQLETIDEVGVPNSGNVEFDNVPVPGVMMEGTFDVTYNPAIARSLEQAKRYGTTVQAARVDVQIKGVGQLLQSTVDNCLIDHGYRRFRLTAEQQRHLRKLRQGSPERHAYLFSLASDPRVMAAQGID